MSRYFAFTLSLCLAGCTVGPDYQVPEVKAPQSWTNHQQQSNQQINEWWRQFNDPLLDQFVNDAMANNHDIAIAKSRLLESRAGYAEVQGALLPSFGAGASAERDRNLFPLLSLREPYSVFSAHFDAIWEVDIFGGRRRQMQAVEAVTSAAAANLKAVHISIIAEVVKNYIDYRLYQRQVVITKENTKTQQETVALTQKQYEAGRAAKFDYLRANSQLKTTQATIHTFTIGMSQAQYRLEILLGLLPGTLTPQLALTTPIPSANETILSVTPVNILQQRPDLQVLERNLAAATALKGAAIADLYPKFSLSAFLGGSSLASDTLFSNRDKSFQLLGGVKLPIFSFGRLQAAVDQRDEQAKQALQAYEKGVLTAFAEVETCFKAYAEESARLGDHLLAVRDSKAALAIAHVRYKEGSASLLDVLDVQRSHFLLEAQQAQIEANVATAYVTLGKALGLGWINLENERKADQECKN